MLLFFFVFLFSLMFLSIFSSLWNWEVWYWLSAKMQCILPSVWNLSSYNRSLWRRLQKRMEGSRVLGKYTFFTSNKELKDISMNTLKYINFSNFVFAKNLHYHRWMNYNVGYHNIAISVEDDGNTSITLYFTIATFSVSIVIIIIQFIYITLRR